MLLAWADGQDVACPFVDLAIDQAEPLRPLAGHVELHPGKPGEVTADLPVTEQLAGHPPVGEIIQGRLRRVEYGRVDRVERREVGGDVQPEGERVWGTDAVPALTRFGWYESDRRRRSPPRGKPAPVIAREAIAGKPNIELILSLLEQLLPHVDWQFDALRATMRAEVHRLTSTAVESLGDLVERVPGLPGGHYLGHTLRVRQSVRIP